MVPVEMVLPKRLHFFILAHCFVQVLHWVVARRLWSNDHFATTVAMQWQRSPPLFNVTIGCNTTSRQ